MKKTLNGIRTFNWRLWFVLSVTLLIPAVYTTVRVGLLGNLPGDWGVNIASQLSWINLLYEIVQEAFILPLFFLLGKSAQSKEQLENKTRTGLVVSGMAYLVLSLLISLFARPLCEFMASDKSTLNETVSYIRLETIASTIGILSKFIMVLLVTMDKRKCMYILLCIQTVLSVLLDIFFISELPVSLHLGVNGIAFTNIIVSTVLVVMALQMLGKEGVEVFRRARLSFGWMKEYGRIGLFSGLESLVRNLAFMLMVSRLVNVIVEQGNYWVANNFIWTWLLLPATAMSDVIKKETAESENNIRTKTQGYFSVSALFSLLWFASVPLWKPFIANVLNVSDVDTIMHVVLLQSGFYVIYIFNCIFDGTIYGMGRTDYMLVQSVVTNGTFYVLMFILWKSGLWTPTLTSISLMFGIGMAVDMIPTAWCYRRLLAKKELLHQP